MKKVLAALLTALPLFTGASAAHATEPTWISAFDNTDRLPNGLIDQRISPEVLSLPILGLRFYRIDGGGAYTTQAPYLGLGSTLAAHFAQPWTPTGFETDNFKFLSVNTGSRLTTIYIADDDDIVNPLGGPYIRQTQYPGTPSGIITSGYTTAWFWLDHGTATYGTGGDFNSLIYRLDVLAVVPEPASTTLLGLSSLTLLILRRRRI